MRKSIHFLNGPNLNLLGTREPDVYGSQTLADIETLVREAAGADVDIVFMQSNIEGELVDAIQSAGKAGAAIVINPAAYTHTSVAIHDALKAVATPAVEIHLSQPAKRETFRQLSLVAQAVDGSISGFGANSYLLGLHAALNLLSAPKR
jgi:3-dehydroquinate dehydratase-2